VSGELTEKSAISLVAQTLVEDGRLNNAAALEQPLVASMAEILALVAVVVVVRPRTLAQKDALGDQEVS
jgi:hypothetical protein